MCGALTCAMPFLCAQHHPVVRWHLRRVLGSSGGKVLALLPPDQGGAVLAVLAPEDHHTSSEGAVGGGSKELRLGGAVLGLEDWGLRRAAVRRRTAVRRRRHTRAH